MRGRPILGAISGLFFGIFLALALMMYGVRPLDQFSVFVLPLIFFVLGLVMGLWAPLGRGKKTKKPAQAT